MYHLFSVALNPYVCQVSTQIAAGRLNYHRSVDIYEAADQTADVIDDYSVSYWQTTVPNRVASYTCGSSACDLDQVQAVWVKEAISNPTAGDTIQVLKGYYQNIARNIKTRFPNAQIAYFSGTVDEFD